MPHEDTIAAIATPIGEGGIGVIRISGPDAVALTSKFFSPISCAELAHARSHTSHYGNVVDPLTGERIDDGLAAVFLAPRSYTGENTVEVSCHGGLVATRRTLGAALAAGCRPAEPGEFTKRAFLNGRIDLAQAEAVLDIIRARTDEAMRVARRQLDGALSQRVRATRDELIGLLAYIEASIDFPDDVGDADPGHIARALSHASDRISELIETADRGRVYREGVRVAIIGRPNVGKSSLLNALVGESRAIVTPIPGTTRDTIEETISIRGIPVRAIDTAGIRETEDVVERIGVDRARRVAEEADIVVAVLDASSGVTEEDELMLDAVPCGRRVLVLNKSDLVSETGRQRLTTALAPPPDDPAPGERVVFTAAPAGVGVADLQDSIAEMLLHGHVTISDEALVSNTRHRLALVASMESVRQAAGTLAEGRPVDLVSIDVRAAVDALGTITGETVEEDVVDRIFSEFCIGK